MRLRHSLQFVQLFTSKIQGSLNRCDATLNFDSDQILISQSGGNTLEGTALGSALCRELKDRPRNSSGGLLLAAASPLKYRCRNIFTAAYTV